VTFPPGDPVLGVKNLHELLLALLNDWSGFIGMAGVSDSSSPDREIDLLSGG
jgi:hypothetical protein